MPKHGISLAVVTGVLFVPLSGCETPPNFEVSTEEPACSGDLLLLKPVPSSPTESLTTALEIENRGEYCVGLVSLTGDNIATANVTVDGISVVSPVDVDGVNRSQLARAHLFEAGQHQIVAGASSVNSSPVVIAVFRKVVDGHLITVGPDGGYFEIDGVEITVPPGALSQRSDIVVRVLQPGPNDIVLGPVVSLGPSSLELSAPITVTAALDPRHFVADLSLANIEGWLGYQGVSTTIDYERWTVTSHCDRLSTLLWAYGIGAGGEVLERVVDPGGVTRLDFSSHHNPFMIFRADLTSPHLRVHVLPSDVAPVDQALGIWKTRSLAEIADLQGVLDTNIVGVSGSRWRDAGSTTMKGGEGRYLDTLFQDGEQISMNVGAREVHAIFTEQTDGPTERVIGYTSAYGGDGHTNGWDELNPSMTYEESGATVLGSGQSVLVHGAVSTEAETVAAVPSARTAIGLSENGDQLFLLIAGGNDLDTTLTKIMEEQGLTRLADEAVEFFALASGLRSTETGHLLRMMGAHSAVIGGRGGSLLVGDESQAELLRTAEQPAMSLLAITKDVPSFGGIVVDNHDQGFSRIGNGDYFQSLGGFVDGSLSMHNTDVHVEGGCVWSTDLAPGNYNVHVFVPNTGGTTESARYRIRHSQGTSCSTISQIDARGAWFRLGTYAFDDTATITLGSTTDETGYTQMMSCDAVWFEPTALPTSGEPCEDLLVSPNVENVVVSVEGEGTQFVRYCDPEKDWGEWEDDERHYLWMFTDSYDNCVARYTPALTARGTYNVGLKYWTYCDQSTHVPMYVRHEGGTTGPIWVDQLVDGKIWNERIIRLGTFNMSPGMGHGVDIRNGTGEPFGTPTTPLCIDCGGEPALNINIDRAVFSPIGGFDSTSGIGSAFRTEAPYNVVHSFGDTTHRRIPHLGVDVMCDDPEACDEEGKVFAVASGVVTYVSSGDDIMPDWGGAVIIRMERPADNPFKLPGGGQSTTVWWLSAHLDPDTIEVLPGEAVTHGQIIGYVGPKVLGATGRYVHVEVSTADYGKSLGAGYSLDMGGRRDPIVFTTLNP
jgi:hypothetical protein